VAEQFGPLADFITPLQKALTTRQATARVWQRDHTLWREDPTEITDRLGWLSVMAPMAQGAKELMAWGHTIGHNYTDVVIMGMGGSSLFPEVLSQVFPPTRLRAGAGPRLTLLDTTDPQAIARVAHTLPLPTTFFIAASKSGTTIETTSQLAYFWEIVGKGEQFAAITDHETALATLGRQRSFNRVFENPSDIGGRFSALSYFGLVPAAILGIDISTILDGAVAMSRTTHIDDPAENTALRLGTFIAAGAQSGRDKLTIVLPDALAPLAVWIEQLVAESTGKHGTGLIPVIDEIPAAPQDYGNDRIFVLVGNNEETSSRLTAEGHPVLLLPSDCPSTQEDTPSSTQGSPTPLTQTGRALGAEVFRWEFATAIAGAAMQLNPFDQPDVAASKKTTLEVLHHGLPEVAHTPLSELLATVNPGDYLALHAYVDPNSDLVPKLHTVRAHLREQLGIPVTLGLGPRFLHSSGQLHKGGPATGVFVQVITDDTVEAMIPHQEYGFSTLKRAQAAGDLLALHALGRRAGRVKLGELLEKIPGEASAATAHTFSASQESTPKI